VCVCVCVCVFNAVFFTGEIKIPGVFVETRQ